MNKSILYDLEIMHGAKMVEKGNITLPKFFSAENIEANAVRDICVMYDLSDKMKLLFTGKESLKFANYLGTRRICKNNITKTIILDNDANIIDIVKMYYIDDTNILVVIGLASFDKTNEYILSVAKDFDVEVKNLQNDLFQLCLMGEKSKEVFQSYVDKVYLSKNVKFDTSILNPNEFIVNINDDIKIMYHETRLAKTYGIFATKDVIVKMYEDLSMNPNVLLGGTDSYNILRKRARRLEYGVDIDNTINPYEASLEDLVEFEHDFIGKNSLLELSKTKPSKKFVGIEFDHKIVNGDAYDIYDYGEIVGRVTSVCHETLSKCIGVGFVNQDMQTKDSLRVKIGNDFILARIVEI